MEEKIRQSDLPTTAALAYLGDAVHTLEIRRRAIAAGISKINIFTDINVACVKAAHDAYTEGRGMTDVMGAMSAAVKEATMKKMLLFGSNGRA